MSRTADEVYAEIQEIQADRPGPKSGDGWTGRLAAWHERQAALWQELYVAAPHDLPAWALPGLVAKAIQHDDRGRYWRNLTRPESTTPSSDKEPSQ